MVKSIRFGDSDRLIEGDAEKCIWISGVNNKFDLGAI